VIGRVRAECFPMREMHMEARAISVDSSYPRALFVVVKAYRDIHARSARLIPRWRHQHDLPVYQFRLPFHLVQILNRGAGFCAHGLLLL